MSAIHVTIEASAFAKVGYVAVGGAGLVFGATTASSLVGGRYVQQVFADPVDVLLRKDGMVLERPKANAGNSAAIAGVALSVVGAAVAGPMLFGKSGASQALSGTRPFLRSMTGAGLLGAAIGIGAGAMIAHQYFSGASIRPE